MKDITIFTPTYNRSSYLRRLYDSICLQAHLDSIEWVVIDDESTDDTADTMQKIFADNKERFPIRFLKQKHGGKHRAINKAVSIAEGDYFFIVDSDDYLCKGAIEKILLWIEGVRTRNDICAVAGIAVFPNNKVIGGAINFSTEYVDASIFDRYKYGLGGDKAEVYKTSILKRHPFPEFKNEFFVTENVCWYSIAAEGYLIRWYDDAIYVRDYLPGGLTMSGANDVEGHIRNFCGYKYYIELCIKVLPLRQKFAHINEYRETVKSLGLSEHEAADAINFSGLKYKIYSFLSRLYTILRSIRKAT